MQSVIHFAEKLIQSVGEPYLISGQELHVTLSVGISMCPDDGVDPDVLMSNADLAMYQAKKKGRNSYEIFSSSMTTRSFQRTPGSC
jgi:diguanylate cyclase (GGDEF)-like protein